MKFTLFILSFFTLTVTHAQLTLQQKIDSTANGKVLTDFILIDIKGDTIHFYDFKEEIIVIDIWATWCGPCKQQAPIYDSLRFAFQKDTTLSIRFISISVDDSKNKWRRFVKTEVSEKSESFHYYAGNTKEHIINYLCFIKDVYNGELVIFEGIPRYVIITKNHVIFNRDSPQPQSGKLDREIKKAIRKK